jgi:GT2 family glycosyltransferase
MFPTALAELRAAAAFIGKPSMMHPSIAFFHEPERWQLHPERMWAAQDSTPDNHPEMGMVEMPFAYGACLWLSAEVLAKIGLFDERFFLQMEEADYFHRAKQFGIRSYCTARAQILHKESATFGGNVTPGKTYYQVRNSLLIVEKHARSWATFRHEISELFWALTRQAKQSRPQISGNVGLLRWLFSRDPLACAAREGFGDYAFRRFGQRTSTRVAEPRGG